MSMERQKRRQKNTPQVIPTFLLAIIVIFIVSVSVLKISELFIYRMAKTFPKLEISLSEVPIEQINLNSKNVKYPNNTVTLTTNNTSSIFSNVEIKGRGNFTWAQAKKPYQIKLDQKTDLFDLKPAKKWLLLANYLDGTHLRNDLAFHLAKIIGEPYALSGYFVELYFDNQYHGLYYLTEKVEVDKSRVNLKDDTGILVELDNVYGEAEGCYYDINNNCLTISDAVNPDTAKNSMQTFIDSFNKLQAAIKEKNFDLVNEIIDVDSFVRYYLLNELIVNPDAYSTSFFLYQDGGKIHAGPGWDFDIAFGYTGWTPNNVNPISFHSPFETNPLRAFILEDITETVSNATRISSLFYDLLDIPEFAKRAREIYQENLSKKDEELLDYIRNQANYIRDAALRDQERWKLKTSFDEEVDRLIDWVAKRYDHFEQTYGINSTINEPMEPDPTPDLVPESPQP